MSHAFSANPLVLCENNGPAIRITLNRADKRNALSRALIQELTAAFQRAIQDDKARVIVLAAAGPVFCAGMDLGELQESLGVPAESSPVWDDALHLAQLYDLIYTSPKPTLAVVQGPAVAGGAGLVSVCDLALASPQARFGYPEVRRGLVAAMVMPHLLRHVGERLTRYLLLTGDLIDAATALRDGLINEVVPLDQLAARVDAIVRSLAEGGPHALAQTKTFLHDFSHPSLSVEKAAKASALPRLTQECQEGLRAFFDKKPAPWSP